MRPFIRAAIGSALVALAACVGDGTPDRAADAEPTPAAATAGGDVVPASHTAHAPVAPANSVTVTVYKSPSCGCCRAWVDHMREAGFHVVAIDTADVNPIKAKHGVANDLASCHTATVGGYVLEGHVPAADVKRLLHEKPAIVGLAVPGMPMGSPGMEGPISQRYDVVAFDRGGRRSVFASH